MSTAPEYGTPPEDHTTDQAETSTQRDANVVDLAAARIRSTPDNRPDKHPDTDPDTVTVVGEVSEGHFDVALDEEPQHGGAAVDALPTIGPSGAAARLPIIRRAWPGG